VSSAYGYGEPASRVNLLKNVEIKGHCQVIKCYRIKIAYFLAIKATLPCQSSEIRPLCYFYE
jgi:hypothetical protein